MFVNSGANRFPFLLSTGKYQFPTKDKHKKYCGGVEANQCISGMIEFHVQEDVCQ